MRELRTEIDISAPPTKVWRIITDFQRWNEWNPIVNQASGVPSLGSKLSMTMRGEDGKDSMKYAPVVKEVDEPRFFRWRGVMMAGLLFTNDKIFELEETSSGTRFVHSERFGGILVPVFWSKLEKGVPPMLHAMNDGLKQRAERSPD